ncbi:MAG: beta-propeller fold lactonase family protein [Acidobacteriia bacterium]|nr:beta-propeller fold lactonase family protein [Terriglobia bacterium]
MGIESFGTGFTAHDAYAKCAKETIQRGGALDTDSATTSQDGGPRMQLNDRVKISLLAAVLAVAGAFWVHTRPAAVSAQNAARFTGPTSSQPLALSADDWLLAVANPDNNTVSIFDVRNGANTRVNQVNVGTEPNGVAVSPDGTRIYVANTVSGTVTVLAADRTTSSYGTGAITIPVGTEPYGLALTPSGKTLYVANARSNSVSVIDTATNQVIKTITDVGIEPRGIAITNNGGADSAETVYVTQFLALPAPGKQDGSDDAKTGRVTVISAATNTVTGTVTLNPLADTGFKAAGDALARVPAPATPAPEDFKFVTGAYPNQLNNIAIRGRFAFVPNTGASPNGPTRFNVNTQSLLSVIDTGSKTDAGKTINMHQAVANQTNPARRFITQPWAMAFKHQADEAYVVSAASNIAIKLKVDPATGAATVQSDPADTTRVLDIPTGKNPRGIVVSASDKTAYVMNYVSRDVTVIDLSGSAEKVTATLQSESLPAPGTAADKVHAGKELYNTSIGEFDRATPGGPIITGRMSNLGWGSCSSCHPFGLSDNVVWIFGAGPRRTVPQHVDFAGGDPATQRALNWSAIFDEEEDFEANIRGVSGGLGLIVLDDGVSPDPSVAAFTPASGGRLQLKIRGMPAWDAIKAYIVSGIRAPISPASKADPDVVAGRALFIDSNCQACHGGAQWSSGKVRSPAPPDASLIVGAQLIAELRAAGTFDASATNEIRATAVAPLGAAGFNPPSLLSLFAFPQTFFHNGSADTLDAVMQNVAHRSAGTGTDRLTNATQRAQLIKFLLSIDGATAPISPAAPSALQNISAASGAATVAPDSFVSAVGSALSTQTLGAAVPYPNVLAGSTVSVKDSAGVLRLGALSFVSPGQINYVMPAATAVGQATVTVASANGATASGTVPILRVAPALFAIPPSGVAAATAIRVNADNSQSPVAVFQCGATADSCVAAPIDVSGGAVYLTLYGTGIRNRSSLDNVRCTIGGVDEPVLFAGAQGDFPALDQVNAQVPASLRGRGTVSIVVTVDGQSSNPVTIRVQ